MTVGDVTISGQDFGRLEGKVDGIAADISGLRSWVGQVDKRVDTLERGAAVVSALNQRNAASKMTWIAVVGSAAAVAAVVASIVVSVH